VSDDRVQARVQGFLQNSQVVDTAYLSDGSVEVTVAVMLRGGLAETLTPSKLSPSPTAAFAAREPVAYSNAPRPQVAMAPGQSEPQVPDTSAYPDAGGL